MRFTVSYKLPSIKKIQKATFFSVEDSISWETYIKEKLNAFDVKIIPS